MAHPLRGWQRTFVAAALFNFAVGIPIMAAAEWTFEVAYGPTGGAGNPTVLMLWRDFGFVVTLIGVGYFLVGLNPLAHRGIVWMGIAAKLFDVVVLTSRWRAGLAHPLVLLPAALDGAWILVFILFLYRVRDSPAAGTAG